MSTKLWMSSLFAALLVGALAGQANRGNRVRARFRVPAPSHASCLLSLA